ncbi:hypothetical protein [Bermanella sp. R86510]|uniref:hypothetical protein n=1 Tax=unclassified Bermanella TaxID=2627862 RepID=UPI0037CA258C
MRIANYGLGLLASICLVTCTEQSSQNLWQDYQMRMENVFDVSIESAHINH